MSPAEAGLRPADMPALYPSSVPIKLGDTWLDEMALDKILGMPKAITIPEIDQAIADSVSGAKQLKLPVSQVHSSTAHTASYCRSV